jgi:hypothetical protein
MQDAETGTWSADMAPNVAAEAPKGGPGSTVEEISAPAEKVAVAETLAEEAAAEETKPGATPACAGTAARAGMAASASETGAAETSAAGVAAAGESTPEPDAAPDRELTEAGTDVAAIMGEFSATATEDERELMKADSSILDCSIMSFTLGENFTPEENSPASLLTSGPFALEFLEPSWSCWLRAASMSISS